MKLTHVSSKYGAPMGRNENRVIDPDASTLFYLQRVPLNSGGYDSGGAYWGIGRPLYWALEAKPEDNSPTEFFFRANDREDAKAYVIKQCEKARFYR